MTVSQQTSKVKPKAKRPRHKNADHLKPHWFKHGQSGNPVGARAHSRTKLINAFMSDLLKHYEEHGAEVIDRVARNQPARYLAIIAKLVPNEHKLETTGPTLADILEEAARRRFAAEECKVVATQDGENRLLTGGSTSDDTGPRLEERSDLENG